MCMHEVVNGDENTTLTAFVSQNDQRRNWISYIANQSAGRRLYRQMATDPNPLIFRVPRVQRHRVCSTSCPVSAGCTLVRVKVPG
jgi:hypothetical protein